MKLPFDVIYILSLKIAYQRQNKAKAEIARVKLSDKNGNPPIWIMANNGQSIPHGINNSTRFKLMRSKVSQSEAGCFASHRQIWQEFERSEFETCLILEDDFRFGPDADSFFQTWDKMPDWDYINFGFVANSSIPHSFEPVDGIPNLVSGYGMWLTHAYAINKSTANHFLEKTEIQFGCLDWQMAQHQQEITSFGFKGNRVIFQEPRSFSNPSFIKHSQ